MKLINLEIGRIKKDEKNSKGKATRWINVK